MFLGGSILSFVLPMAAFIVIAGGLFYLYRRPHRNPRLKYLEPETVTSVGTREPGPVPAPAAKAPATPSGRRRHGNRGARSGARGDRGWPRLRLKDE